MTGPGPQKIGRYRALGTIKARIGEMKAGGRGGAVFVLGATGHGPGGVAERFRHQMGTEGCRWLAGHCREAHHGPFQQVLREVSLEAGEHRQAARELSEQELGQCREEYRNLIVDLARERPMVLALEDWHLADRAAVEIFEFLLGAANQEPILFLISLDPQRDTIGCHSMETAQRIVSKVDVLRLRDWTEKLQSIIEEKVGGEPFVMEESKFIELLWAVNWDYLDPLDVTGDYKKAVAIAQAITDTAKTLKDKNKEARSLKMMGIYQQELGNHAQALECQEKALKLAEENGDKKEAAACLTCMGIIKSTMRNHAQAMEYYERTLKIREESGDRLGLLVTLSRIGKIHFLIGDHAKARDYLGKVMLGYEELGSKDHQADCLLDLGFIHEDDGEYTQALDYYQKALMIADQTGNKYQKADCLLSIGDIHQKRGIYSQAINNYDQAKNIVEKTGDILILIKCYIHIGALYIETGNGPNALECLSRALAIQEDTGFDAFRAATIIYAARAKMLADKMVEARRELDKALALAQKTKDLDDEAGCYAAQGLYFSRNKEYQKAEKCYQDAIRLLSELKHKNELAHACLDYGLMLKASGDNEKAREQLERAKTLFEEMKLDFWVKRVEEEL